MRNKQLKFSQYTWQGRSYPPRRSLEMPISSHISGGRGTLPTPHPAPHPKELIITATSRKEEVRLKPPTQPRPLPGGYLPSHSPSNLASLPMSPSSEVTGIAWRTFMLVSLEGRHPRVLALCPCCPLHLSPPGPGPSPPPGTAGWVTLLHTPSPVHPKFSDSYMCSPPGNPFRKQASDPERGRGSGVAVSVRLTHRVLRSLCSTARGAHCWRGGGGPPREET